MTALLLWAVLLFYRPGVFESKNTMNNSNPQADQLASNKPAEAALPEHWILIGHYLWHRSCCCLGPLIGE